MAFGDKVAFEDTLDAALNALFGGNSGADNGGSTTPTDPGQTANPALTKALQAAKKALDDKAAALRAGDWTAYGEADKALQAAIDAALKANK